MKKNSIAKVLFILIFLLGFLVRFIKFGKVPTSLYWDEVAILADARVIAETGKDMHGLSAFSPIRPSYGDYKLSIYILLTSVIVKLFGVSNFSVRFISLLAGLGNLILVYFFTKKVFFKHKDKKIIALFSMLALAITPWSILFSRTGFESHLACFLFNLSIYFLFDFEKIKIKNIFLSVFFGVLATYTYYSVRFIWPFIFLIYFMVKVIILKKKTIKTFFIYFFKYFFIPLLIYFFSIFTFSRDVFYQDFQNIRLSTSSVLNSVDRDEINLLREWSGNSFFSKLVFNHKTILLTKLIQNYSKNISFDFLFFHGDPNLRHSTGEHGLFLIAMILPFIIGLIALIKDDFKIFIPLVCWWVFSLLPASVPNNVPHALRSLNALFPLIIFIGYGFYVLFFWWNKKQFKFFSYVKTFFISIYILFVVFNFSEFIFFYFGNYCRLSSDYWQYGYRDLVEKIDEEKDSVNKVDVVDFDDRFYLWYLAFGDISPREIQKLKSNNFRFEKINNINFNFKVWDDLENKFSSLVICANESCQKKINEIEKKPSKEKKMDLDKKISDNYFSFYYF